MKTDNKYDLGAIYSRGSDLLSAVKGGQRASYQEEKEMMSIIYDTCKIMLNLERDHAIASGLITASQVPEL